MGFVDWIKRRFGYREEDYMEEKPPKPLTIRFSRVSEKVANQCAEFVFVDSAEEQSRNGGFRATTAVLLTQDGRIAVNVSVCSDLDQFERKLARDKALGLVRYHASHNIFVSHMDLENYGMFKFPDADTILLEVSPDHIRTFLDTVGVVKDLARNKAMSHVHSNRNALQVLKEHGHGSGPAPRKLAEVMAALPQTK